MIKPVNSHLLIEPLKHEAFISSERDTYQEIGIVVDIPRWMLPEDDAMQNTDHYPRIGDRVYFDSWLAAKYPKNDNEFYWLVKWEDVRAIEKSDNNNA